MIVIAVILFVLLSFLKLSVPDTTEDGYHTDLPTFYLQTHTSMHETRDFLHVIPYPQLAEMIYTIPIFLGHKDAVRFIHFGFYLLIVLLLFQIAKSKDNVYFQYAPILFASAPIVIRYSTAQYTDFFMLLCFLLSVLLIQKKSDYKNLILPGVCYGAVISIKMWMLIYLPVFLLYIAILQKDKTFTTIIKSLITFIFSGLLVVLLWYIRAFIITGNPIYPIFATQQHVDQLELVTPPSNATYFGFNRYMFTLQNMAVYSPLFFLGIIFSVLTFKRFSVITRKYSISLFVILLFLEQLVVKVNLGRYLLSWYTVTSIIISVGIYIVTSKKRVAKYLFFVLYSTIFCYYLLNTLLVLPYGFGWADSNKYLTRVLFRDNVSYYDFDHLFKKHITKDDLVSTFRFANFYYADFHYSEVGYIFTDSNNSFDILKQKHVTKLLINGGDISWFCRHLKLKKCTTDRVKLLVAYPQDSKKYYLYEIEK